MCTCMCVHALVVCMRVCEFVCMCLHLHTITLDESPYSNGYMIPVKCAHVVQHCP